MQTSSTDWRGKKLGRYHLLHLLGRGGMGEVWLADDTQLRRQVAIKMLPAVYSEDRRYLQGFTQEAQTAASLEHPHILPVHDFGEERIEGDAIVTYLVLPFMPGGSLRDRLYTMDKPFSMTEGLRYLRQAAQAIDYAHSKQVLHRDIKPANMLLQQDWLLLADFGIAKILNETQRSRTHAGAGTPEYMAPEQAQGHAVAASDLYSLAVIAYQMLTGSVPFRGETPYHTLMLHITTVPEPLSKRQPSITPVVEAVVLKGLAKQATERQASCIAFVDELERALQGSQNISIQISEAVQANTQAKSDPDMTVLAPWSKRTRNLEPVKLRRYDSAQPSLSPAVQAPPSVTQTQPPFASQSQTPLVAQTQPQPITQAPTYLPPAVQPQPPLAGPPQIQPISQPFAWSGPSQPVSGSTYPQTLPGQMNLSSANRPTYPISGTPPTYPPATNSGVSYPVPSYSASPSGMNYAASAYPPPLASGASFSPMAPAVGAPGNMPFVTPQQKNKMGRRQLLIAGGGAAAVILGGTALTVTLRKNAGSSGHVQKAQVTLTPPPGPQKLIKGIPLLVLSAHNAGVTVATWHHQGRYLASGGSDGNVMLWDIASYLKRSTTLQTITAPLKKWKFADEIFRSGLDWSADGRLLAAAVQGDTNKINIIEPFTKKAPYAYTRQPTDTFDDSAFEDVAWSPKTNTLAGTIFFQGDVSLFDPRHTTNPFQTLKSTDINSQNNQPYDTTTPAWSLDGRYLAGQAADFKALIWDVKSGKLLQTLAQPSRTNQNFVIATSIQQWSPRNVNQLAMVNLDAVQTWDALKNRLEFTLGTNDPGPLTIPPNAPQGWVPHLLGMSWSPNGRYIAGGYARSNLVYVWDTQQLIPSKTKDNLHIQNLYFGSNGHSQAISNLAWSPDGKYIATTSSDTTVIIWQVDGK